jgi:hypothetical protein
VRELAFRVFSYSGDQPIGAFPTLFAADEYARSQIEHNIGIFCDTELQETGYYVGRYVAAEGIAAMIRYVLTQNGIARYGYTPRSPEICQERFEKMCQSQKGD